MYEKQICENTEKFYSVNLTVSEFKGVQYLNLRKYFLSYEAEYIPSKEGLAMEYNITNVFNLLDGLINIVSKEEAKELVEQYFIKKREEIQS
jgi:Transcriptional Coactivator p15 (PC4)